MYILLKLKFLGFILIFFLAQLGRDISISSETEFILKDAYSNGELMGIPLNVEGFSDSSFVIHEYAQEEIKRFDKEGKYLTSYGRKGRGPGEFTNIYHMFVDRSDQILATDRSQRKIVVVDGRKKEKSQDYFFKNTMPSIKNIHQTKDGKYVAGVQNFPLRGIKISNELYHYLDEEFNPITPGFVLPDSFLDNNSTDMETFYLQSATDNVNSVLTHSGDLVVAPYLYTGMINVFTHSDEYKSYNTIHTHQYGKSSEVYDKSSESITVQVLESEGLKTISNESGMRIYYQYNESKGLFKFNSGEIIHFVRAKVGRESKLFAEILNKNATELIGVIEIERLGDLIIDDIKIKKKKYEDIPLKILHLDKMNRLFVYRMDQEIPELHVIRLNLEIN